MTAKVPVEVKLTQIAEMFRMCGLAPLSEQINEHLEGELELPQEDLDKIIAAGERFARASRSVGLKELPYMDEPHKYADGEADESDQSGAEDEAGSDDTGSAEEPAESGDGEPDAEDEGEAAEPSEEATE